MKKKSLLFLFLLPFFYGCQDSSNHETVDKTVYVNQKLPFPPIENYNDLDDSLKPPTLQSNQIK